LKPVASLNIDLQGCVCAECGAGLSVCWGGSMKTKQYPSGINSFAIRCANSPEHDGIARPFKLSPYDNPDFNLFDVNKKRRVQLEQAVGTEKSKELIPLMTQTGITMPVAKFILKTIWKDAPDVEVLKAALRCAQYDLNPLMGHLFLIKFDKYKDHQKVGEDWACVIGIKATRLMAARQGSFSYLDNTPRVMTEEEQIAIFGEVNADNVVGITKLRDTNTGAEAQGYGLYPKTASPKGLEKGNSRANMVFIRSERNAFDRLRPGMLPADIDVVDEKYAPPPTITVDVVSDMQKAIDAGIIEEPPVVVEPTPAPKATRKVGATINEPADAKSVTDKDVPNYGSLFTLAWRFYKISSQQVATEVGFTTAKELTDSKNTPWSVWQGIYKLHS
jgi:hypothetical protein